VREQPGQIFFSYGIFVQAKYSLVIKNGKNDEWVIEQYLYCSYNFQHAVMHRFFISLIVFVIFTGKAKAQHTGQTLPVKKPSKTEQAFFSNFQKKINTAVPSLGSFALIRHDTMIYEHYFHGGTDSTLFNIKSITKSVISAMGGIARDKNLLPELNTPVLNILTEYNKAPYPGNVWFAESRMEDDSIRKKLSLQNLLTMQTGFEWDDFGPLADAYVSSSDPVKFMLDLSFADEPGETFNYCSGASSVFGAVLDKVLKTDLKDYANENLFNPIQVTLHRWDKDPTGRYVGASEMYLTTQDLLRFGMLYLNSGKANGKQVISEAWIKESLAGHATLNKWPVLPNANGYGYFWWRRKTNGHQAYIASGAGGQLICIVPDLDMVIAATCFFNEKNRGRMEIKLLHSFIDEVILALKQKK
jgi:CubicO group peptidase (beta-lactamase class C family)